MKERLDKMQPLGIQRLRVLDCLDGNCTFLGQYFFPDAEKTVFVSFRVYVLETIARWANIKDPVYVSNLAAGCLLIGEIDAAGTIIDLLPEKPYKLDHGAGRCLVAAVYALSTVLPLPPKLRDTKRWTAGSTEQAELRAWLAQHRDRLTWMEVEGEYRLHG